MYSQKKKLTCQQNICDSQLCSTVAETVKFDCTVTDSLSAKSDYITTVYLPTLPAHSRTVKNILTVCRQL